MREGEWKQLAKGVVREKGRKLLGMALLDDDVKSVKIRVSLLSCAGG